MSGKSVLEVLSDKGYIVSQDPEMGDQSIAHGDDHVLTSALSADRVELMLWDDFANPFKPEDFDTVEEYADAIIKRFHQLVETSRNES